MQLTWELLNLHPDEPFVSNKGTVTVVRQFLVRLHWEGRVGLGTAICDRDQDTIVDTLQAALEQCASLVAGASPYELEHVLIRLEEAMPGHPAAVAAVDMALHDLLGQAAGLPLHRLWGLAALPVPPTGLSLGALPEEELQRRARQLTRWPILKLKLTPASDIHCVSRLRQVYPGRIWVDGNGAWDAAEAIEAAEVLWRSGVELLEQPVRPGAPDVLRFVRERSPLPIVADEDCRGPADVLRLQGCADAVNIKLLKCGGLRRALEMIRLARRAGLLVMLGCKTESVLGITAMAQLAGLADYLDLDGHLDLHDDPFTGVAVEYGQVRLPGGPGLGVSAR